MRLPFLHKWGRVQTPSDDASMETYLVKILPKPPPVSLCVPPTCLLNWRNSARKFFPGRVLHYHPCVVLSHVSYCIYIYLIARVYTKHTRYTVLWLISNEHGGRGQSAVGRPRLVPRLCGCGVEYNTEVLQVGTLGRSVRRWVHP